MSFFRKVIGLTCASIFCLGFFAKQDSFAIPGETSLVKESTLVRVNFSKSCFTEFDSELGKVAVCKFSQSLLIQKAGENGGPLSKSMLGIYFDFFNNHRDEITKFAAGERLFIRTIEGVFAIINVIAEDDQGKSIAGAKTLYTSPGEFSLLFFKEKNSLPKNINLEFTCELRNEDAVSELLSSHPNRDRILAQRPVQQ
ncbi:MAG: hypothetical protein LBK29_01865 [Oscillospiraceae bacterium]|jgi:hypothetical protein|nr:hypothetical protein [Oscillospiraceae bacterium]